MAKKTPFGIGTLTLAGRRAAVRATGRFESACIVIVTPSVSSDLAERCV